MSRYSSVTRALAAMAVSIWSASAFAVATVEHDSSPIATPSYNVDLTKSSVSGISSGGYMAQQFHVANSAWMVGAGIFAGGPYFCAENNVNSGAGRCLNGGITKSHLDAFLAQANTQASAGRIDALSNLANDRVWLFHGKLDRGVKEQVMDSLNTWYQMAGVPSGNIVYERERQIQHTWPTKYYSYPGDRNANANACGGSNPDYPWLGQCDWDSAGAMLQHVYGPLNARNAGTLSGTVKAIRQTDHFNAGGFGSPASMNPKAYVYVPNSCATGTTCRIHVAFHGCEMNYDSAPSSASSDAGPVYGLKFVLNSGLNEWADTNNIIVLYPQAKKSAFVPLNPKGCWDFWNYEGGGVPHTKQGKQIDTVRAMMTRLAAGLAGSSSSTSGSGGGTLTMVTYDSISGDDGYVKCSSAGRSCSVGSLTPAYAGRGIDALYNRAVFSFDTSGIPDGATITRAYLTVTYNTVSGDPWSNPAGNTLVIDVKTGTFGAATMETGDWASAPTASAVATIAKFTSGTQQSGDFNSDGIAAISKTGKTQVRLRFDSHQTSTAYIGMTQGSGAKLTVVYQ